MGSRYDFFEHESEVTPTVQGLTPKFNKVSQYIVKTDDQFLDYLHRGCVQLDFYRAVGTNYEVGNVSLVSPEAVLLRVARSVLPLLYARTHALGCFR
jgi:hypothetical protein